MNDTTPGPTMTNDIGIYKITKGCDLWRWLCRKHLAARKDDGWSVQDRRKAQHGLTCDDCTIEAIDAIGATVADLEALTR
jgi:hypothetical protein